MDIMTRANGKMIELVIVDPGYGIAVEQQAWFSSCSFPTKKHGLGLSICSSIIRSAWGRFKHLQSRWRCRNDLQVAL
jgi:C4-dicarboxylate-specific signal transduction histidine kinase